MKHRNDILPRSQPGKPAAGKRRPKAIRDTFPTANGYWYMDRQGRWMFQFTVPILRDQPVPLPDPLPDAVVAKMQGQ